MSDSDKRPTAEEYNAIVQGVTLLNVHLIHSISKINEERLSKTPESNNCRLTVPPPHVRFGYSENEHILFCGIRLKAVLEAATEDEKQQPSFSSDPDEDVEGIGFVFAEYSIYYRLPEGAKCTDSIASMFTERNSIMNIWPFFREHVFSSVHKMGFPRLILPLLKMHDGGFDTTLFNKPQS